MDVKNFYKINEKLLYKLHLNSWSCYLLIFFKIEKINNNIENSKKNLLNIYFI